jgi:hypothetical protein
LKPFGHHPTAVKPLASKDFKRAAPKGPALNSRAWSIFEGNKYGISKTEIAELKPPKNAAGETVASNCHI